MQISDLVAIGKLGNKIDEKGFIPFIKFTNFQLQYLTDVFLVFKDNRVRYVSIVETSSIRGFNVKLDDTEIAKNVAYTGNVKVMIAQTEIMENSTKIEEFIGKNVVFRNNKIGVVKNTFDNSAHIVLVVELKKGKELLVPAVDYYLEKVDDRFIFLENIEELLNL